MCAKNQTMGFVDKILFALAVVLVHRAAVADRSVGSSMIENPRIERSGSETSSNGCEGGWCKAQRNNPVGTIWFGPRLGRRRRSDNKLLPLLRNNNDVVDLPPLLDLINIPAAKLQRLNNNAVVVEDNNKRQEITFTPRLGRELEGMYSMHDLARLLYEQIRELDNDDDDNVQQEQQQKQTPPNFPPRLGRNLVSNKLIEYELRRLLQQLDL